MVLEFIPDLYFSHPTRILALVIGMATGRFEAGYGNTIPVPTPIPNKKISGNPCPRRGATSQNRLEFPTIQGPFLIKDE